MDTHLIIGAGGLIGTKLVQRLSSRSHSRVLAVDVREFLTHEETNTEVLVLPFQSQIDFDALSDSVKSLRIRGSTLRSVTFLQTAPEPSLREKALLTEIIDDLHFTRSQELRRTLWLEYKPEDFRDQFEAHVIFTHQLLQSIYKSIKESEDCSIVFVGSVFAQNPVDQRLLETREEIIFKGPGYSAAKAALSNYMLSLSALFCDTGVRFNLISPGPVSSASRNEESNLRLKSYALGERLVTAEEVAEVLEWLHAPSSKNVRGQVITVANGFGGF
jgi:NAD(P)-dependent dehydrogenase (short-subunit alcohol dehydrogenase family)